MMNSVVGKTVPNVLCLSGLDPTGGAGLQADIEAIASMGAHACPVITAMTVQDTNNVSLVKPVDAETILKQADTILNDMPISCIKIGLLGSVGSTVAVASLLKQHPNIPVVLDPILRAGGGALLNQDDTQSIMREDIIPQCTLITPNLPEAQQLTHKTTRDDCAKAMIKSGAKQVLITGTHDGGDQVINSLFNADGLLTERSWIRLDDDFHGSGCTLSSSIAGLLAQNIDVVEAADTAQKYTWNALQHGYTSGRGQQLPQRFYWKPDDVT